MKRLWFGVRTARRAGAVVELAVVSPLLLTMLMGIIEFGYIFMMQQNLTNATREACRLATLPGTTDAEIRTRLQDALAGTGLTLTPEMVTIDPPTMENPVVTVNVAVPYEEVTLLGVLPSSLFSGWYQQGCEQPGEGGPLISEKRIGSSCAMRVEGAM